jgi:hypothetical protein
LPRGRRLGSHFYWQTQPIRRLLRPKTRFRIIVHHIIVNHRKEPQGLKPEPI